MGFGAQVDSKRSELEALPTASPSLRPYPPSSTLPTRHQTALGKHQRHAIQTDLSYYDKKSL